MISLALSLTVLSFSCPPEPLASLVRALHLLSHTFFLPHFCSPPKPLALLLPALHCCLTHFFSLIFLLPPSEPQALLLHALHSCLRHFFSLISFPPAFSLSFAPLNLWLCSFVRFSGVSLIFIFSLPYFAPPFFFLQGPPPGLGGDVTASNASANGGDQPDFSPSSVRSSAGPAFTTESASSLLQVGSGQQPWFDRSRDVVAVRDLRIFIFFVNPLFALRGPRGSLTCRKRIFLDSRHTQQTRPVSHPV